jgi:uncharacterized protein YqeY
MADIRRRLRDALHAALKASDEVATAALRSAISAIANAEAVAPGPSKVRLGVGAGDVPRRDLSDDEVLAIIRAEVDERLRAAAEYEGLGKPEHARRLRSEGDVLSKLLT